MVQRAITPAVLTFHDWPWQAWASHKPEQTALFDGDTALNWQQVCERINRYTQCLPENPAGKIVSFTANPGIESVYLLLALIQSGANVLAVNPKMPSADIEAIAGRTGVAFHIESPAELVECRSETLVSAYASHHIATLTLTSGSTGLPKAVAHTVSNHLHSAAGILQVMPLSHDDCWLLSLPIFHVSGLAIIWRWLLSGARMKVAPVAGEQLFSAFDKVSHASLVPTQLQRLLVQGKPDTLKEVLLGGAEIPVALTEDAERAGIRCWCGYGMTEMASTITVKRADGELTVGAPMAYRQVEISGESEVLVGGGPLSPGYMVEGKLKPLVLADGLFATRDRGEWFGEQGDNLRLLGRLDNMFICGGENVQPEAVERILAKHPDVSLVFVLPVADAEFGSRPVAIIEPLESETVLDKLPKWAADKLAPHQRPMRYFLMPDSVKGNGIKISRAALGEWLKLELTT
ncbi:o-succinylbenzoate--CoA ligase [Parasalinivibrio latis]|uniref:o-succinylbenzoate--CoA ligase n=1 Tax=Parasalinivibrio latis TaxID=2952610 RepID=UPI0030DE56F6